MPRAKAVNLRTDDYDVRIDRRTKWGNPFTHLPQSATTARFQVATREQAIESFKEWVTSSQDPEARYIRRNAYKLRGKRLGCHCSPMSCHGDVLAWLAEMRRWKPGTLVTGFITVQHTMLFVFEETCREHVFELTDRAVRSNHGTGWVQSARCIVCEREVPPLDIEWWQQKCTSRYAKRALLELLDMARSLDAAVDRLTPLV